MARHGTPGLHTHQEWLGLVQPVGLVVAPVVLDRLGLFPEAGTARLADGQRRLKELLKPVQDASDNSLEVVSDFPALLEELLDWQTGDLVEAAAADPAVEVRLDDYNDVLRPTHLVPAIEAEATGGSPWQALVQLLPAGTGFDDLPRDRDTTSGWQATPQQRFERLLKDSEHPLGLLFNGVALRLIHAPRGESSGHITFPLEPMTTVAGRPMLAAMQMLLVADRLFESGNSERRLPVLLAASRKEQNEVSTRLAEQVLEALWELLSGFDQAERLAAEQGRTVLADLATSDPGHIYGGLITVLLRLVFLLYAEDEELMPPDALYGQHYSVSGLAGRLRQERAEHQGGMADRRGAWASLLSLFRLVYDGGGADPAYLPARHGELFDPDAYPFLEGRERGTTYAGAVLDNLPAISDDVVEKVLAKLIWLDGERLSYRALDVEQIGSVYEGIMGFQVEQAQAPAVGISYRPPRQKIRITVVVNAAELLAQSESKCDKWLEDITGVKNLKLPAQVKRNLKEASSLPELCQALGRTLSPHTPRGLAAGSLVLQPTAERRRSGSHYTPRVLTDPIAAEAFRPWLERCNGKPTADQVLALKVCDPAMGSGAFLVATCRYLAGHLVAAWEREGFPDEFDESYDKDIYARRLVAQRCLYGVDKNPFAVNLAKLSLWLVTLSKKLPFTFVDHALKCGDSLVGHSVKEIQAATEAVQLAFLDQQNRAYERMGIDRRESFAEDSRDDAIYDRKQVLLEQQIKASDGLRQAGDLMVAAFFDASKRKTRAEKQQVYLAMLSGAFDDAGLQDAIEAIRERLAAADQGIRPFHWDLEFPEVFAEERGGFDVFVGNPPFLGGRKIKKALGEDFQNWLQQKHPKSNANTDLSAFFFLCCFALLQSGGALGLIATNTISQGDTRRTGLRWICLNGGTIYAAHKRYRWPGVAAILVSVVHLLKGIYTGTKLLNRRPETQITAFLLANGGHEDPKSLAANDHKSFQGSILGGSGFTFDDSDQADDDTTDTPSPIATMERLITTNLKNQKVIFPYIGGKDVNDSPTHSHHRYVIDFRDRSENECRQNWPEIMNLLERKVKPHRQERKSNGEFKKRKPLPQKWWIHSDKRPALYATIAKYDQVFVISCRAALNMSITKVISAQVLDQSLVIFADQRYSHFACISCSLHEAWMRIQCSSTGDTERYSPTDCYITFPFPYALYLSSNEDDCLSLENQKLEAIGENYFNFRAKLMLSANEGLTTTYNRFHDPGETSSGILELRRLHSEMDQAVLNAYGWSDVPTACGYSLDYLDADEDIQLPTELQECIDSGDLFFRDASDACAFQGQLKAITGKRRKLPWRYRWPDDIRDDVLARLLVLNAERYAEEVAQGLHSKATKSKPAGKRGRRKKSELTSSTGTAQLGLGV